MKIFKFTALALMLLISCRSAPLTPLDLSYETEDIELYKVNESTGHHPYFDDKSTLFWHKSLEEAQKSSKQYILIEIGRRRCAACRTFVEKVLPQYRQYISHRMVGYVDSPDHPNAVVDNLQKKYLPGANLLPIILIVRRDLSYVGGAFGNITPEEFFALLKKLQ